MDWELEWIIGSGVFLDQPWKGVVKLSKMLASAVNECLAYDPQLTPAETPVLLCLAEKTRPGRLPDLDNRIYIEIQKDRDRRGRA